MPKPKTTRPDWALRYPDTNIEIRPIGAEYLCNVTILRNIIFLTILFMIVYVPKRLSFICHKLIVLFIHSSIRESLIKSHSVTHSLISLGKHDTKDNIYKKLKYPFRAWLLIILVIRLLHQLGLLYRKQHIMPI